jgi:cellulose synthase operon protein C
MVGYRPTQIRKPSDETDFEKNCVVLFKYVLADPNVKRVGTRGQKQKGVDIIGKRNRDSKQPVGVQCKLKSEGTKLSDTEVKTEVKKALTFRPKLTEYFIVYHI